MAIGQLSGSSQGRDPKSLVSALRDTGAAILNSTGLTDIACDTSAFCSTLDFILPSPGGKGKALTAGLTEISTKWGRNRLEKELRDQGYVFDRPTKSGGGQLFRNSQTGEEVRVMQRPEQVFRNDPPAKHEADYYYRYRSGPDQPWGPYTSIPDK